MARTPWNRKELRELLLAALATFLLGPLSILVGVDTVAGFFEDRALLAEQGVSSEAVALGYEAPTGRGRSLRPDTLWVRLAGGPAAGAEVALDARSGRPVVGEVVDVVYDAADPERARQVDAPAWDESMLVVTALMLMMAAGFSGLRLVRRLRRQPEIDWSPSQRAEREAERAGARTLLTRTLHTVQWQPTARLVFSAVVMGLLVAFGGLILAGMMIAQLHWTVTGVVLVVIFLSVTPFWAVFVIELVRRPLRRGRAKRQARPDTDVSSTS